MNPPKKKVDINSLDELVIWAVAEIEGLKTEIKWIKYTLYVVLALLAALIGIKVW